MNQLNDPDYKKTNRQKVQTTTKVKFWCLICDMCLVGNGIKCPVCNKRNGNKKSLKKT